MNEATTNYAQHRLRGKNYMLQEAIISGDEGNTKFRLDSVFEFGTKFHLIKIHNENRWQRDGDNDDGWFFCCRRSKKPSHPICPPDSGIAVTHRAQRDP